MLCKILAEASKASTNLPQAWDGPDVRLQHTNKAAVS